MARQRAAPFDTALLTRRRNAGIVDLLPACYRTGKDDIIAPFSGNHISACLEEDLQINRLDAIHDSLWMAGRPMPPRHLGYQQVLGRNIILTEKMELHLIWKACRIYIKPLSKFLLDEQIWLQYLGGIPSTRKLRSMSKAEELGQIARGFLITYCSLISYESDFRLARDNGLIPQEVSWRAWKAWTREVLDNTTHRKLNRRFWYGELRLGRLNMIYRIRRNAWVRGYGRIGAPSTYGDLLSAHFKTAAIVFGYVVVVLTAMQVGLATDQLKDNKTFQGASWVFTIVSILVPLAAGVVIICLFLLMFVGKWTATMQKHFEHTEATGSRL